MSVLTHPTALTLAFSVVGFLNPLATQAAEAAKAAPSKASSTATNTVDQAAGWKPLFDGKSLKGWKVTDFAGHAEVSVNPNFKGAPAILFESGAIMTGITLTNPPPKPPYEITLEAMKVEGSDFFCALTFPAGGGHCSLVVGGWGGGVVGISSIDSMDASENETTKFLSFEPDRWYRIRVRVTPDKIETWIDKEKIIDVVTKDRRITVRPGEIELNEPFGLAAYQTKAAFRDIRVRDL